MKRILQVKLLKHHSAKMINKIRETTAQRRRKQVFDLYSDFGIVRADPEMLPKIVASILDYNKKAAKEDLPILGLYFDSILEKAAAATDIQS